VPRFVDLATFASINALIQGGMPRDAALAAAGVCTPTWDASLAFWLGRMADEATHQRFGLSQRYSQLYAEALKSPEALLGPPARPRNTTHDQAPASAPLTQAPASAPLTEATWRRRG
jgi:hypothetical protein